MTNNGIQSRVYDIHNHLMWSSFNYCSFGTPIVEHDVIFISAQQWLIVLSRGGWEEEAYHFAWF